MPALEGLRILDMTQYEAGTCCTQSLAFLGADVVKVGAARGRRPGAADAGAGSRSTPSTSSTGTATSAASPSTFNRPEGRELLLEMAPHYDVFIENYGPGVIEKLDIGYEVMREPQPGPHLRADQGLRNRWPLRRLQSAWTWSRRRPPARSRSPAIPTGRRCAPARRWATPAPACRLPSRSPRPTSSASARGKASSSSSPCREAMTYYLRTAVSRTQYGQVPTPRTGNGDNPFICLYPCAPGGPNDYVFIMAVNPRMWGRVCEVIGKPELMDDPRFKTREDQQENYDALFEAIAEWTRQRTKQEAMTRLAEAGVCASHVYETHDLFSDPPSGGTGLHQVAHSSRPRRHPASRLAGADVRERGADAGGPAARGAHRGGARDGSGPLGRPARGAARARLDRLRPGRQGRAQGQSLPGEPGVAREVVVGGAEEAAVQGQATEVVPDRELLGHPDTAVHLHDLLGEAVRALAHERLGGRGRSRPLDPRPVEAAISLAAMSTID